MRGSPRIQMWGQRQGERLDIVDVESRRCRPRYMLMRRWPWLLWVPVYVASELILLGSHHRWLLLALGGALMLTAFAMSLRLSLGRNQPGPRPRWFLWAVGGVACCYAVVAAVAGFVLGPVWALGALAAGVIPMTAVALLLATVRSKTISTPAGLRDRSGDAADPAPGIGIDDDTPIGDTSAHSDAPRDRRTAEGRR
jgi:hypothetical protein